MQVRSVYFQLVDDAAAQGKELWRTLTREGRIEPTFLYCRPSFGRARGELRLFPQSEDPPAGEGWERVVDEPVRGSHPVFEAGWLWQWIHDHGRRAPILPSRLPGDAGGGDE
jgi:hypothetical protein